MRFNSYCYLANGSPKTWDQAQEYCKSLGATLVKINSFEENEFVLDLAKKQAPSVTKVWIGMHYYAFDFYWHDYSIPVYKNWAIGKLNGKDDEPCVQMFTTASYLIFQGVQLVIGMTLNVA